MTKNINILEILKNTAKIINEELRTTFVRRSRIIHLVNPTKLRSYLRFNKTRVLAGESWRPHNQLEQLSARNVKSYKLYTELQSSKLDYIDLESHEVKFRKVLRERLKYLDFIKPEQKVLCLGARLGAEVRAFLDLGCFAVGIDLNPGEKNKYVLYGDFHDLQFASDSIDIVYTNSLDHVLDLSKTVEEIHRVLKRAGHIIVESDPGSEESDEVQPDMWQTLSWKKIDDLVKALEIFGLKLIHRQSFEYPRGGEQLVFILQRPTNNNNN